MKNKNAVLIIGVGIVFLGGLLYSLVTKNTDTTTSIEATMPDAQQVGTSISDNSKSGIYTNPNFAFSFVPPTGFVATAFEDFDQAGTPVTTVVVEDQTKKSGAQIVISPWDESPETLTPERIMRDIPNMRVSGVTVRDVANIGTVIEFESDNADFGGSSREVWFVAHGDLYQMSTNREDRAVLDPILATWKFQ